MKLFKVTQPHNVISYILAKNTAEVINYFPDAMKIELKVNFVYITDSVTNDIIQSNSKTIRKVKR